MRALRTFRLALVIVLALFALAFIYKMTGADIVSVNSGGTSNITITPSGITEGFFTNPGFPEAVPPGGGGIIPTPVPIPGGGIIPTSNLSVIPGVFNLTMLSNTNILQVVSVKNIGSTFITISVTQSNLTDLVILGNTSLTLAPGQIANLNLIFVAPNATGIYQGTIHIGDRVIPVSLNVIKQFILFDSNIVVLNKNYRVPKGELLQTAVTMIPMGDNVRMDVNLNYTIRNVNGTVYNSRLETVLVTSQQTLLRNFGTGNLPFGNYTIDLQLIYPYGVAPSNAHFEVVSSVRSLFSVIAYWILIIATIIAILIIILIIIRTVRRLRREMLEGAEQKNNTNNQQSVSYI